MRFAQQVCHVPHADFVLRRIDSRQYTEIMALAAHEPLPHERAAAMAAKNAHVVARSAGNKVPFEDILDWFAPDPWNPDVGENGDMTPEAMERALDREEQNRRLAEAA
jgi:hypothetical protein